MGCLSSKDNNNNNNAGTTSNMNKSTPALHDPPMRAQPTNPAVEAVATTTTPENRHQAMAAATQNAVTGKGVGNQSASLMTAIVMEGVAALGHKAMDIAGDILPFFGPIYHTVRAIVTVASQVLSNEKNVENLAMRLRRLITIVQSCEERLRNSSTTPPRQKVSIIRIVLEHMDKTLQETLDVVKRYCDSNWLSKAMQAGRYADSFSDQDAKLSSLVSELCLAVGMDSHDILNELRDTLPDMKIQLDNVASTLDEIRRLLKPEEQGDKFLQIVKRRRHALMSEDVEAKLSVYVPLRYSLRVPSQNRDKIEEGFMLEPVIRDVLSGKPIVLDAAGNKGIERAATLRRGSTLRDEGALRAGHRVRMVLVQGGAGTGKSLFGWHLFQCYEAGDDRIPIFISLPMYREVILHPDVKQRRRFIPEFFQRMFELDEADVRTLHDDKFVFILDGLDELGDKVNLYRDCQLHQWVNSLFFIGSRTGFLVDADIKEYIAPIHPGDNSIQIQELAQIYLLPFTKEQFDQYIVKFSRGPDNSAKWNADQYRYALRQLPQLSDFGREPLTLFMILRILPLLSGGDASSPDVSKDDEKEDLKIGGQIAHQRLDPRFLLSSPLSSVEWCFPRLRRVELYALFFEDWCQREIERLLKTQNLSAEAKQDKAAEMKRWVEDFCQILAFEMFSHVKTSVRVGSANSNNNNNNNAGKNAAARGRVDARLLAKQAAEAKRQSADVDHWASNLFFGSGDRDQQTEEQRMIQRQCSPLRRSGDVFSFLHKSLQEYFAAIHISTQISGLTEGWAAGAGAGLLSGAGAGGNTEQKRLPWHEVLQSPEEIGKLSIAQKLLTDDYAVLRFCMELIDNRVRYYQPSWPIVDASNFEQQDPSVDESKKALNFQPFGRALWDLIEASRHHRGHRAVNIAAANAATLLNAANITFSGRDLSNVQMGGQEPNDVNRVLPFVDLSGATLNDCNLDGANLFKSRLQSAYLNRATMRGTDVRFSIFGQRPFLTGHSADIKCLALSRNGKHLLSGGSDKTIIHWDLETGKTVRVIDVHTHTVYGLLFDLEDKTFYSCSWDTKIYQWDVETGKQLNNITGHTSGVVGMAMSVSGKYLFTGGGDKVIRKWSIPDGKALGTFSGHSNTILVLCVSPDDAFLFSGAQDFSVRQWNMNTLAQIRVFTDHTDNLWSLAVTDDCRYLFSGAQDKTIRQYDLDTGETLRTLTEHTESINSLAFSFDGKYLFSGSSDNTMRMWMVETGEQLRVLMGHSMAINCLALTPDNRYLLSGSWDKTIRQWSLETGEVVCSLTGHTASVESMICSLDDRYLFSGSYDNTIRQWACDSGELIRSFVGHTGVIYGLAFSADHKFLWTGGADKTIKKWSLETGLLITTLKGHTASINGLTITTDGRHLYSCSSDKTLKKWSTETNQEVQSLTGHTDVMLGVEVSMDGKYVFTVAHDHTIRQWSARSGEIIRVLNSHTDSVYCIAISADGRHLYSGSGDKTIKQWSISTGDEIRTMTGHDNAINKLIFSADGKYLYSCSRDKTVRQWSVETGTEVSKIDDHTESVWSMTLSHNNKYLFCGCGDKTIRGYDLASGKLGVCLWNSGPYQLTATDCKLAPNTRLDEANRQLLEQHGAVADD